MSIVDIEQHRIRCPHCLLGGAVLTVERRGKGDVRAELGIPLTCDKCARPFRARARVQFIGVALEDAA